MIAPLTGPNRTANRTKKEKEKVKLSNQAMGAIMMALQKSLLEQSDIVPVLKSFQFQVSSNEELTVKNPPNFKIPDAKYPLRVKIGSSFLS